MDEKSLIHVVVEKVNAVFVGPGINASVFIEVESATQHLALELPPEALVTLEAKIAAANEEFAARSGRQ